MTPGVDELETTTAMTGPSLGRPFEGRTWRAVAFLVCAASVLWLASGFLIGAQVDEEEYRHTIPSTIVAAEAMHRGELAFWTSQLGLGVPQPFGQSLAMHPLTLLVGLIPLVRWVQLFYAVHLIAAACGMWLVLRRLGGSALAAAMGVATYVLASPAQNYALRDFWPSTWPVYTLMPLVLLALLVLCDARTARSKLLAAVGLGLTAGLIGCTGHQGYFIVFIPACLAFLAPHVRQMVRSWPWWLLAAGIAGILAAPIAMHVAAELGLGPDMLDRHAYTETLTLDSLWDIFARPFGPPSPDWVQTTFARGIRVLFFGGPAAVLAIVYVVAVRTRVDLALGALVSLLPLVVPGLLITQYLSAIFLFRDPLILFAVPCAVLALDWLAARGVVWRWVAAGAVAAQLVVLGAAAWPFIALNLESRQRRPADVFVGELPISSWLRDHVAPSAGRVYYSAGVDQLLWARELEFDGLWRNSMFYRGVPVVTASFSFVSIRPLALEGEIRGLPEVTSGDLTLLDLAGVRWVLARADETVSPALVKRAERTSSKGVPLVLYEYPSTRGAAFVDTSVRTLALPLIPGCAHDRLFCRDFSRLASHMSPVRTRVDRTGGQVRVTFDPAAQARLLLVGEMFRPGWQVAEPGAAVEPLLGALVGVSVPPHTGQVTLRFRPPLRAALTIGSWTTMLLAAGVFAFALRRPKRQPR